MKKALYLLVGKEEFLKKEFIQNLRKSLFPQGQSGEINFQEFHAGIDPLGAALDFARTAPFLGDKRLAVLWGIDDLAAEEKESLLAYTANPAPASALVLVSGEGNANKNGFLSGLSRVCAVTACHVPFERDLPQWIQTRARKSGVQMESSAAPILVERAGKDVTALSHAIEELALYVHPRTQVLAKDVESLLGRSAEADVFELSDMLIRKNVNSALEKVEALFRDGARAYEIVAALASQFDRLRKAGVLMREGKPDKEVGAELKVHPFFLDKFLSQAKGIPEGTMREISKRLLSCDEAIKTSRLDERLAVERLVLEVTSRF